MLISIIALIAGHIGKARTVLGMLVEKGQGKDNQFTSNKNSVKSLEMYTTDKRGLD